MIKKFFGPFPDEPLLYIFDKILELFHKFDSKLKCKEAEKQIDKTVSVAEKINEVINETATENDATNAVVVTTDIAGVAATSENDVAGVTVMEKISMEIVETSSHTSKRSTVECITIINSDEQNQVIELPQERKQISAAPKSILKTTSSMECNYPLSKVDVTRKGLHTNPVPSSKRVNRFTKSATKRYTQTKGFGDSVTVVEDRFETKLFRADGKNRFESILKQETKQKKIQTPPNINRLERCNQTLNELTGHPHKAIKNVKLKDRKVTKTEWAVTRISTFDDESQTYEIMKKDKVLDRNGGIEKIFAMAPNLTTVAYNPLKLGNKKR